MAGSTMHDSLLQTGIPRKHFFVPHPGTVTAMHSRDYLQNSGNTRDNGRAWLVLPSTQSLKATVAETPQGAEYARTRIDRTERGAAGSN